MAKVLITTVPFGDNNPLPLKILKEANIEYRLNPIGRKLKEEELLGLIGDYDFLIAGTESITERVINKAHRLKFISRVGIGLDGVDLTAALKRGIQVSYTPDAPAPAVSELTMGLMLSLLRHVHLANSQMHEGQWHRYFGRRLSEVVIGIVGAGRIGERVIKMLLALGASKILVNDTLRPIALQSMPNIEWVDKEEIYKAADVISLHIPLSDGTRNMIRYDHMKKMKTDAILINTSRGGIINELDLIRILDEGHFSGVAVDVFEEEPYYGDLRNFERCLLTSHMGSMSIDCRARMEIEATEEVVRFFLNQPLRGLVPSDEYEIQSQKAKS